MMRRTSRVTVAMTVVFPRSRPMCASTRRASSSVAPSSIPPIRRATPGCVPNDREPSAWPPLSGPFLKISTIHDSRLPTPWYGKSGCIYNHFGFLTTQRGDQSRGPRRRRTCAREGEDDARYGRGRPEGRETSSRRAESRVESSRRAESLAREDEKETNLDVDSETHPVVDKGS